MILIANECANCRRPLGYIAKGALQIPTFCVICAGDKEIMKEWGHRIDKREQSITAVLVDYRFNLDRMNLRNP